MSKDNKGKKGKANKADKANEDILIINGIPTPFNQIDKRSKAWRDYIGRTGNHNPKGQPTYTRPARNLLPYLPVLTVEQISEAIEANHGILPDVAKACDLSPRELRRRLLENPKLQAQMDDAKEDFVGIAERHLLNAIKQGDIRAIIYALKCQGRKHGWNPDQAISVKTDMSVTEAKAAVATLFGIDRQDESDNLEESDESEEED